MKSIKRGLALLLAVLMILPSMPTLAAATDSMENAAVTSEEETVVEKTDEDEVTSNVPEVTEGEDDEKTPEVAEGEDDEKTPEVTEGEEEKTPEATEQEEEKNPDDAENIEIPEQTEAEKSEEPEKAAEDNQDAEIEAEEILFNTGSAEIRVVTEKAFENGLGDVFYAEDGSYTINIPEENPFFPYEVQFTYGGETTEEWFMSPNDSVEIGGHTFYVSAYFDNTVVTQMSLNVAGNIVTVYPDEKEFTNDGGVQPMSLLPLEERYLNVNLSGFTPAELTMVSVDSIFTGDSALTDTSKVVWTYSYDDDYTVSSLGDKLDLSINTYDSSSSWEMIVGEDDQLAAGNIRYRVHINTTASENWLTPVVYTQDEEGKRENISLTDSLYRDYRKDDRRLGIFLTYKEVVNQSDFFVALNINPSVFGNFNSNHFRIYKGAFANAAEAMAREDITDEICNADMMQENAGYKIGLNKTLHITMVTFDAQNNVTGCLPFYIHLSSRPSYIGMSLYKKTETGRKYIRINYIYSKDNADGSIEYTTYLYKGYPADDNYGLIMNYYQNGTEKNSKVTAAYEGKYTSIAQADAAGAMDIKNALFDVNYQSDGYIKNYMNGVNFTVFVGEDESEGQEVYQYCFKTEETDETEEVENSSAVFNFWSFKTASGKTLDAYMADSSMDSYADFNYVTVLVGADADLTNLAPEFWVSSGANLYTEGSSTPEVSGKSYHDFSKGPVQYTVSSEDGKNAKNYWVQVIKPVSGAGQLYINSLSDQNSNTKTEKEIIYSTREIMLDGYHDDIHDILLTNIGTEEISHLSVELASDTVELDDYWTLKGVYGLSGFTTVENLTVYGELPNLAKIRLTAKEGVERGEVAGTLKIKSGEKVLMVLTLTGTIGDPGIVTEEIPHAVQYVPYGTMIQNGNKYSWNQVSYNKISGTLPAGMVLRPNGEIYGVPREVGEFTFTVRMTNSYSSFTADEATFTLVVMEHTDANVDGATDSGYDLSQRVQNISSDATGSQTLVSEGEYVEFVDIWLDGVRLTPGTDYTSEAGSTRITIRNQTLLSGQSTDGIHTLGIEFRTQDTDVLKRAAQNYRVYENGESGNGGGSSSSGNSGNDGDSGNGGNSGNSGLTGSGSTAGSNALPNDAASNSFPATGTATGPAVETYTVQPGDSLWKIAKKFYGTGDAWQRIFDANKDIIKDPNKIYVGQKLTIYITEGSLISSAQGDVYIVQSGDSLWKISRKVYGEGRSWKKIYHANTDKITNPNRLYAGQILTIP